MIAFVAWLVFLVAVPIWAWKSVDEVDADPGGDRPAEQPGTTYLIVGSDSRAGLNAEERKEYGTGDVAGQRTDTMMLLHTGSGPTMLMSLPRDSIVDIPGHGTTKLNAAYAFGGPKLLIKTIENETGIRIDHYAEIGLGGVPKIVDAVGGIEVCPRQSIRDPKAKLRIKKGCQDVDGATALAYSRTRKFKAGDIVRARNQREVVAAVGKKILSPWTVLNPVRYVRINAAATGFVTFGDGTGPVDAAKMAWAMTRTTGDKGLTCGVPISDLAVNWDAKRAPELFKYVIDDDTESIPSNLCTPSGLPS